MQKWVLVRQARNFMNMKQKEFAAVLNVCPDEISKWERNDRPVPDLRIYQIKYYFDKHVNNNIISNELFKGVIFEIENKRKVRS